jgi:hypothetical protein
LHYTSYIFFFFFFFCNLCCFFYLEWISMQQWKSSRSFFFMFSLMLNFLISTMRYMFFGNFLSFFGILMNWWSWYFSN